MFDTRNERERSLGFGIGIDNMPDPDGEIDAGDRSYIWGSFQGVYPPNPYFIPNHVERALSLLIEQLKRRNNVVGTVTAIVNQAQLLENAFSQLLSCLGIDNAYGASLNAIGEVVGQKREGMQDAAYRNAIRFRIQLNISSGQPDVLSVALSFFTNSSQVRLIEVYPGAIRLFTYGTSIPGNLQYQMQRIVACGVRVDGVSYLSSGIPFEFSGEGGVPYGEGDGFSEYGYIDPGTGQPIGGNMCELST